MEKIKIEWIDVIAHTPSFVKIKNSRLHKKGAFCKKKIKKGTFLGNYFGKITQESITGPYIFQSRRDDKIISIDATNISYSNWTRYMNCSTTNQNENVTSYYLTNKELQHINDELKSLEGYIVFYSNRDIEPKEELLYYYGNDYAKRLNINYKI